MRIRKFRLDTVLVERGLAVSWTRAQAAVLAGEVYVRGARAMKPGMLVPVDAVIEVKSRRTPFVSRGGEKLEYALRVFELDVTGAVVVDVGASTGGFTDCLLQRGARRVFAVDVGTGQLDWRLRKDPRAISLEQRDIRTVTQADLGGPVDLATVDVAFVSLTKVLPVVARLVRPAGTVLALVKPQFEVGPKVARRGVVWDAAVHRGVLAHMIDAAAAFGLAAVDATHSPIAGPDGNLEFFLYLKNAPGPVPQIDADAVVSAAHATVKRRRPGTAVGSP